MSVRPRRNQKYHDDGHGKGRKTRSMAGRSTDERAEYSQLSDTGRCCGAIG